VPYRLRDPVHRLPDLGPQGDLQGLQRGDAAELGSPEGRDVAEPVLVQPRARPLAQEHRRDGVHAAGQPLGGDEDVGVDAVPRDAPELTGAHEPDLHLVGDVQRVVLLAQTFDLLEVARLR
jgi:hypothetical protein